MRRHFSLLNALSAAFLATACIIADGAAAPTPLQGETRKLYANALAADVGAAAAFAPFDDKRNRTAWSERSASFIDDLFQRVLDRLAGYISATSTLATVTADSAISPQVTMSGSPTSLLPAAGADLTTRIEAGNATNYIDTKSNLWIADAFYTDGPGAGMVDRGPIPIAGTTDPRIFQTEHYCVDRYTLPVVNGTYTVNLLFAETDRTVTGPGQRVFDVDVGGRSLTNFDVYAEARGSNIAVAKTFDAVPVTGGSLSITFSRRIKCNIINGIEITANTANTTNTASTGLNLNLAPTVNAGPDQTITLPAFASLSGSVSDDGLPLLLTTTWSKVSGPGTVAFADASAQSTTASFPAAGSYLLRLTASDSALSSSDDIAITVNTAGGPPPGYVYGAINSTSQSYSTSRHPLCKR